MQARADVCKAWTLDAAHMPQIHVAVPRCLLAPASSSGDTACPCSLVTGVLFSRILQTPLEADLLT